MFGLKVLINFASASGNGKINIFAPQVSTNARAKFLSKVESFIKNEDRFGWVKFQFSKLKVIPRHNFLLYGICINLSWNQNDK